MGVFESLRRMVMIRAGAPGPRRICVIVAKPVYISQEDRILKTLQTLSGWGSVSVYFIQHPGSQRENNKVWELYDAHGIQLRTLEGLPRGGRWAWVKGLEFFCRVRFRIGGADAVWCNEVSSMLFLFSFGRGRQVIWDLHELPFRIPSAWARRVFRWAESRCSTVVHANRERLQYLVANRFAATPAKHVVLENYPADDFSAVVSQDRRTTCKAFIYLQGLGTADRLPYETLSAALQETAADIVIVGTVEEVAVKRLVREFGCAWETRVRLVGRVPQSEIARHLTGASASIVLYKHSTLNNRYCAPNRLYQSLACGIPVVVGNNPSMATVIERTGAGVVLRGDGSDVSDIRAGLSRLMSNWKQFRESALEVADQFRWSRNQVPWNEIITGRRGGYP